MAYISFQPNDYFNTKLYTGSGSAQSITGVGFQPDLIWGKNRSATWNHILTDAVRGANKQISSNLGNAESSNTGEFTAFGSDGFSVGTGSTLNGSGNNIVSWNWRANGQGSSNTDGTINTTYTSANTTAGISIIKYTGNGTNDATIGHGLGVAPQILIGKCTGNTTNWQVVGKTGALTEGKYLQLNTTDAIGTSSNVSFDPTATTVKFQGGQHLNTSGQPHIAYCFAEKKGFSKFGSYTGNGNADGTFIYTGFKPALIIRKRTDTTEDWAILDNKRLGYNPNNYYLFPNGTNAESAIQRIDFLSNGFKLRTTDGGDNASNGTYIYMCFAEEPLVSSNGVAATAR